MAKPLSDPVIGPALGALGDEAAPAAAVAGDPAVGAIGRIRDAGGDRRQRGTARQQPEQRRKGGACGADPASPLHQVPRGHPLAGRYLHEQPIGLLSAQRDGPQRPAPIPGEDLAKAPAAEAAVGVVEKNRSRHAIKLSSAVPPARLLDA